MKQNLPTRHVSICETWILLKQIKDCISRKTFLECLGVGPSQENRYCLPPTHDDHRRNPIDRVRLLVTALAAKDGYDLANTLVKDRKSDV